MARSLATLAVALVASLALCSGLARACSYTSAAVYQQAQAQFAPAPACGVCQQQAVQVQAAPAYAPPVVQAAPVIVQRQQAAYAAPAFVPSHSYGFSAQASFVRQRSFAAPAVGYGGAVVASPGFARSVTVERRGLFGRRVIRSATVVGP